VSFFRWLRSHAEHYLLIDAQRQIARQHGALAPRSPHGVAEFFWLKIFAPAYRVLPWPLRHKIMLAMPGSHRRSWAPPPKAFGSALQSQFPRASTPQEKESGNGADRR
jgi:hypothetical protein